MDQDACQRATRAGYAVVNKGSLSPKEVRAFEQHCGMVDADVRFPKPPEPQNDYEADPGTPAAGFAEWAKEVAEQCGVNATVRFFNEPDNRILADCEVSTTSPTLRFNEGTLGQEFLREPYGDARAVQTPDPRAGARTDGRTVRRTRRAMGRRSGKSRSTDSS